jgi:hypothetical protein
VTEAEPYLVVEVLVLLISGTSLSEQEEQFYALVGAMITEAIRRLGIVLGFGSYGQLLCTLKVFKVLRK